MSSPIEIVLTQAESTLVFVVADDDSECEALALKIRSAGLQAKTCRCTRDLPDHPSAVPSCVVLGLPRSDPAHVNLRGNVPTVLIASHADVPTAVAAMKAGAVDFLTRPVHDHVLLAAVQSALERSRRTHRQLSEVRMLRERHATLTPREREVMALVASGLLNKQVGFELGISEITVKAHRGKMMRKMQARTLAALLAMAARLGELVEMERGAAA